MIMMANLQVFLILCGKSLRLHNKFGNDRIISYINYMENKQLTKDQKYRLKDLEAYREKKKKYAKTPKQKEKRKEYMRLWREKNREKHNNQARFSHANSRKRNPDKVRENHLKYKYGISQDDYQKMLSLQDGKCKICRCSDTGDKRNKHFHVDHNHETNEVRGLLCSRCNTKLGWYEKYYPNVGEYLNQQNEKENSKETNKNF